MSSYFLKLQRLKLDSNTNLWSYMTIKGMAVISLKYKDNDKEYTKEKKELLKGICKEFKADFQCINGLLEEIKNAFVTNGYKVKICKVKASSRVLVGASESFGQLPFGVGLFFDPVFNVPFIPGSSLKGAFKYALYELVYNDLHSKGHSDKEARNKAEDVSNMIFGSERGAGFIGVSDAYPVKPGANGLIFEPDVITPHYPNAQTELDVTPNPVQFLTIARDVEFQFYIYFNKTLRGTGKSASGRHIAGVVSDVGLREGDEDYIGYAIYDGDLVRMVQSKIKVYDVSKVVLILPWVDRAVLYAFAKGVGAKTSIGYSKFEVIEYKMVG